MVQISFYMEYMIITGVNNGTLSGMYNSNVGEAINKYGPAVGRALRTTMHWAGLSFGLLQPLFHYVQLAPIFACQANALVAAN